MFLRGLSIVVWLVPVPAAWGQGAEPPDEAPSGGPRLVVEKETIDLGTIKEGETVETVFVLENKGEADLVIDRIRTSCGCTTVKLAEREKTIAPGGKQPLTTQFNSKGRAGKQRTTATIYSNDPQRPMLKLTLTLEVLTLSQVVPNMLYVRNVRRGEVVPRTLDVLPGVKGAQVEIISLKIPGEMLSYTAEPMEHKTGGGQRLRFRVDPDAKLGPLSATAKLTVRVGDKTDVRRIHIQGEIIGDLTVRPTSVHLHKASARGIKLRPVTISSVSGRPFQVLEASAGPYFKTTVEPGKNNAEYTILLEIAEDSPDGPCGVFLEVRTDSAVQPLIRVPVYGHVAPRVYVDPPLVLLKGDGSPEGATRRLLVGTPTGADFSIEAMECDRDFIDVAAAQSSQERPGQRVVSVSLNDRAQPGTQSATVVLPTDVAGAERVEIPVTVTVGEGSTPASRTR